MFPRALVFLQLLFRRVIDELCHQLGKGVSLSAGRVGKNGRGRHAGNGVGFQDPCISLSIQHEVGAVRASAAKRLVGRGGQIL